MKRTKYIAEFKSEAVKQILDKEHSAVEVSSRLGVPVGSTVYLDPKTQGAR